MQHIPHTSSAAGAMEFATSQTYPYATPTGQNGIMFDPNYSRSYAAVSSAPAAPDNYATNALTGLAIVGFGNDEAPRNGESTAAAVSKSAEPLANVDGDGSAANHHLPTDANNSRTMSPNNNNSNQPDNYEANSANTSGHVSSNHTPPSTGAAAIPPTHNGSDWDWSANEKMYQEPHKAKNPEEHTLVNEYNSVYYGNQNAHSLDQQQQHPGIKKEKSEPSKAQNQFEPYHSHSSTVNAEDSLKMEGKHKDASSRHDRSFVGGNENQKYPSFNHQSYFNMYYPSTAYGMEHASSSLPMSKYHSVIPPPPHPPSATYSHHHQHQQQAQYPDHHHQDTQHHQAYGRAAADGKDKKVYQHDDSGATSANSLLATNESGNDESGGSAKNNTNNSTYDKSRKESKLYQPQLNLHNESREGGAAVAKDCNNLSIQTNGESAAAAKGESYGAKHQHHHLHQAQQSNRLQMSSPSSMAIKEEPVDGYYHHTQQIHSHNTQNTEPRDYQQSKLYQPQNGYYPMYDLNGVEDTTSHPVSCPTNFEKEIPAHTYHIPGRLNGGLEDISHYGKLPNGIKSEPLGQDYNSDGGLNPNDQQFYNGEALEKVSK